MSEAKIREPFRDAARAASMRPLADSLFAALAAISADAIIAVDDEQRIIFFNASAERIFGYAAGEVFGRPLAVLLPERYAPAHRGHVRGFGAAHEQARRMGERQEISGRRRNGEEFPAEASIARIEVEGRNVYTAVLRDVTERKRIEDRLRVALRARDEMAGIVSHDLRNPVQAVKMLAGAILAAEGEDAVSAAVAEQTAVIRQAAEQMDALIQDLLDATRIESGQLHVAPRPEEVAALVSSALATLAPLAAAKGLALVVELGPGLPPVLADAERVAQLLSNLVGNAIKFTPRGGRVTVGARLHAADAVGGAPCVEIAVCDTGPGIPAEQLPHVFERYWQMRPSGRLGAGLGLVIAKGIAEAHGGRIWAESTEGEGTRVAFTLPTTSR
ncbi:MAG: sensor histidine kinase [Gemmatimonadaceae bacterium]